MNTIGMSKAYRTAQYCCTSKMHFTGLKYDGLIEGEAVGFIVFAEERAEKDSILEFGAQREPRLLRLAIILLLRFAESFDDQDRTLGKLHDPIRAATHQPLVNS
jgi:hypothetical protein